MYVLLIKNTVVKLVKSISAKDTIIGFRNILYKLGSFLMDFKHNLKKVGGVIYQIVGIFMSNSIRTLISLIDNDNCTKIIIEIGFRNVLHGSGSFLMALTQY